MIERILMAVSVLVSAAIMVDAAFALPLRWWPFMDCHFQNGHDICVFSARLFVMAVCDTGLAIISIICVCNAKHLKEMSHEQT